MYKANKHDRLRILVRKYKLFTGWDEGNNSRACWVRSERESMDREQSEEEGVRECSAGLARAK